MYKPTLIRLYLDRVLGNVSIIEVQKCVCEFVRARGVQAGEVLREERIGVNINNEGLKCRSRRVKGGEGDGLDENTGGGCVCVCVGGGGGGGECWFLLRGG